MDINPEDFMGLSPEEQRQMVLDALADVSEVWMGDTLDDKLMRSMVASTRALAEGIMSLTQAQNDGTADANPYILGMMMRTYTQNAKNFKTVIAVTDMKKKMQGN